MGIFVGLCDHCGGTYLLDATIGDRCPPCRWWLSHRGTMIRIALLFHRRGARP